jgi:large repetitive protein
VLQGTPTLGGRYSFAVAVTDAEDPAFTVTQQVTTQIGLAAGGTLPGGFTGEPYSQALTMTGGVAPYAWSVPPAPTDFPLPPGLTLSPSGVLSGTPTVAGSYVIQVSVEDSQSPAAVGTGFYDITIGAGLAVTSGSPPPGTVGAAYSFPFTASGGVGPYAWSVAGSLPPGLSLSAAGVLQGTPTLGGRYSFAVAVTDAEDPAFTVTQQVTLTINLAPQSIGFTAPVTGIVGQSATLTATGGGSGNPVVFTVDQTSGAGVCTVSGTNGTTVNYTAAGSCVIDANQAGNASYLAATQVTATIMVDQAPAFVMDSPPLTAVAGQAYSYTFAASGTPAPTYALAAGAPSWLSISASTGQVTGTPPAGTTSFGYTVTATNTAGAATAGPFTVTVAKATTNADISITMTCPTSLAVGGTGTCALKVANAGPASASKVAAAVLLPAALSEVSCTAGCTRHGNVFTWALASLASGASSSLAITVKASKTGTATVLAVAASQNPDPNPKNNIATAQISIKP